MTTKRCPRCKETKIGDEFHTRNNGALASWCRQCCKDYEKIRNRAKKPKYTRQVVVAIPSKHEFLQVLRAI